MTTHKNPLFPATPVNRSTKGPADILTGVPLIVPLSTNSGRSKQAFTCVLCNVNVRAPPRCPEKTPGFHCLSTRTSKPYCPTKAREGRGCGDHGDRADPGSREEGMAGRQILANGKAGMARSARSLSRPHSLANKNWSGNTENMPFWMTTLCVYTSLTTDME